MKPKSFAQLVLKTIGITAIIIVSLNLLSAIFSIIQLGEKISALHYQYGLFEVNGKPVGMNFVDLKYWLFLYNIVYCLLCRFL